MRAAVWTIGLAAAFVAFGCSTGTREEPVLPEAPRFVSTVPGTTTTAGQPWSYQVEGAGEPPPTLTADNLPDWLSLDADTQLLQGTPGAGDFGTTELVELRLSNGSGPDATQVFELVVEPSMPAVSLAPAAVAGTLTPPTGAATDYLVETAYGSDQPDAAGAFDAPAPAGRTLALVTRGGQVQGLTVLGEPSFAGQASPRTTAATLVFLTLGAHTAPVDHWDEAFAAIDAEASLGALESAVAADAAAGGDLLASPSGSLMAALQTSADAVAATLNTRANAAAQPPAPPYVAVPTSDQVVPAAPRSGVVVDAGQGRVINNRRRHAFTASTAPGRVTVGAFHRLPAAAERGAFNDLDTTWKAYQSEGGFSFMPQAEQLLIRRPSRYEVTVVGSSLRTGTWPQAGSPEREVFRRAFAADCAQLHLESLALVLGFDLADLGGLESTVGEELGNAGASMGIDADVEARSVRGPWALIQAFQTALQNPTLRAQLDASLAGRVDGASGSPLDAALSTVQRLAQGLNGTTVQDSPVLLYLEASDAVVTFEVTPGQGNGRLGLTIVLTWGQNPSDLDSHLTGPEPTFGRFHLYYPHANGNSPVPRQASLDLDDTSSFGPETTAILGPIDGTYRYSVHDFTNSGSAVSTALGSSEARVTVFVGANPTPAHEFDVPSGAGTLWTVFEYDGATGQVTPVNQLSFQPNSDAIQ
jgi:hypothetical protein